LALAFAIIFTKHDFEVFSTIMADSIHVVVVVTLQAPHDGPVSSHDKSTDWIGEIPAWFLALADAVATGASWEG
jgi:hypothetical protein